MSRKYSIGFLFGIIIIVILFILGFRMSYHYVNDKQIENIDELNIEDGYYVKEKDGYITVYLPNGSVYEYTSITTSQLPESIQNSLSEGIHLENLSEVYGFLENYSS